MHYTARSPPIMYNKGAYYNSRPLTGGKNGTSQMGVVYKQWKWNRVNWSWGLPPLIQQNHHGKSWRDKQQQNHNRAKLAGNAAALINEHTHITTDSAGAQWKIIRNCILYPHHKHSKLLETIRHHIQISKDTIHLYKVKAHAGILGN